MSYLKDMGLCFILNMVQWQTIYLAFQKLPGTIPDLSSQYSGRREVMIRSILENHCWSEWTVLTWCRWMGSLVGYEAASYILSPPAMNECIILLSAKVKCHCGFCPSLLKLIWVSRMRIQEGKRASLYPKPSLTPHQQSAIHSWFGSNSQLGNSF